MIASTCCQHLFAMQAFIRQVTGFALRFAAGGACPVFARGVDLSAVRAFDGKFSEQQKHDPRQNEERSHEFKLHAVGKLAELGRT